MHTLPLKSWVATAILMGIQGATPVWAAVHMISVAHQVWGDAGETPTGHYDETASVPIFQSISHFSDDPEAGEFYFASSFAEDWSIHADRDGYGHYANAYARNTYVFKPITRQISISLTGGIGAWWFENDALMMLTNLNTNSIVSSYQSPSYFYPQSPFPDTNDMVEYPINRDITVSVNPEHDYELMIYVGAHRGEGGHGSASLNLTIAPEPDTTLLAGMAVLLMCARRQRQLQISSI